MEHGINDCWLDFSWNWEGLKDKNVICGLWRRHDWYIEERPILVSFELEIIREMLDRYSEELEGIDNNRLRREDKDWISDCTVLSKYFDRYVDWIDECCENWMIEWLHIKQSTELKE